jgi:hypothetical protein
LTKRRERTRRQLETPNDPLMYSYVRFRSFDRMNKEIEGSIMKRIWVILLAVTLVLVLAACAAP